MSVIWTGDDDAALEAAYRGYITRLEVREYLKARELEQERLAIEEKRRKLGFIDQKHIDSREPGWEERSESRNARMARLLSKK